MGRRASAQTQPYSDVSPKQTYPIRLDRRARPASARDMTTTLPPVT